MKALLHLLLTVDRKDPFNKECEAVDCGIYRKKDIESMSSGLPVSVAVNNLKEAIV